MLQDIRANSQGTIAKIIIGLIVISFSIFGIESLLFSGGSSGVAEVNGEEISPFALQQELSVQQRQLLSVLGDDADPALLDEAQLTQQALDVLVSREIMRQAADGMDLRTSDSVIGEMIASMEQFQIDGSFSRDMFRSALASAGFTPALFRQRLAEDMQIGQLRAGIAGSDFSTPAELDLSAAIALEGRDVRYITLPLVDFLDNVDVSDAAIEEFYADNQTLFLTEEQVVVEYLELNLDDFREPISEERLREEFELVRDDYEVPTETRVSHILFEGSDDERASRVAEAMAALEQGLDFAAAAEQFSDDIGSAQAGGDLGYTAGDTFPEAMEEAIAALDVGQQSAAVETDAGTHLLLVTDRREGSSVSFEDVAEELEYELQQGDAGAELLRITEQLRDLVFNAPDLQDPASELGLEVRRSEPLSLARGDGIFAQARLRQAAFADDVLDAGHNSEVIELSPEQFVALRVAERRPASVQPLADVRDSIAAELREAAAQEQAASTAQELLTQLESGASVETVATEAGLEWQVELGARRDSLRLPLAVRERLFAMPAPEDGAPVRDIIADDADASYLIELDRVTEGAVANAPPTQQRALRERIAGEYGGVLQQQFERVLRDRAEVVLY
jgi:peptidyl-prolyl cis-trans isomerase D